MRLYPPPANFVKTTILIPLHLKLYPQRKFFYNPSPSFTKGRMGWSQEKSETLLKSLLRLPFIKGGDKSPSIPLLKRGKIKGEVL